MTIHLQRPLPTCFPHFVLIFKQLLSIQKWIYLKKNEYPILIFSNRLLVYYDLQEFGIYDIFKRDLATFYVKAAPIVARF